MIKFLDGVNVYLRPVSEQDIDGEYTRWINDRENDCYTEHAVFPHSTQELKEYARAKWADRNSVWLAIIDKKENKHVGNIELTNIDFMNRKAEYKIIIDKNNHGKGFGFEASKLILTYALDILNLNKIYLGVNEKNTAAVNLYKKLGFLQEGLMREELLRNGEWHNKIIMALFKDKR